MSKIVTLLNLTDLEYELMRLVAYWRWCQSVSINDAQTQMVLANASVNKYYNMEYDKCEKEFLESIKNYPNATPKEAMQLYKRCTFEMFNRKFEALINQAKNAKIQHDTTTT